jgi:hypothetical protein
MYGYGQRYLESSHFISFCSELRIDVSQNELEHYESEGVLLPVARVIMPDEYVQEVVRQSAHKLESEVMIPGFEHLDRLLYGYSPSKRLIAAKLKDEELTHQIDWEFAQGNKFLMQPKEGDFKPWHLYSAKVRTPVGAEYERNTAKHYYHYWQAYQVYSLQQHYPVFAKYPWVLAHIKEADLVYLRPSASNRVSGFNGRALIHDALSYYIELYQSEEARTFAAIPLNGPIKRLNDAQLAQYHLAQAGHAQEVYKRYDLSEEQLYRFMLDMLERRTDYGRDEKMKLTYALDNDLIYLGRFTMAVTNMTFEETADALVRNGGSFWAKENFRHLDKALEVYDHAKATFERLKDEFNKEFPNVAIATADIDSLMTFIEAGDQFIIPFTIFETDASINNPIAFQRTERFIGLKNLTTGLECLLRQIAIRPPKNPDLTSTLRPLIQSNFPEWNGDFHRILNLKTQPTQPIEFIDNILDIYTDPTLDAAVHGPAIRRFLIAYWARNMSGHYYTLEDDLYSDLYGIAYKSVLYAMLYSWGHARSKGWV